MVNVKIDSYDLAEMVRERNDNRNWRTMSDAETNALADFLEGIGEIDFYEFADNYGINGEFADYNLETKESDYLGEKATDEKIEEWKENCLFSWEEDGVAYFCLSC